MYYDFLYVMADNIIYHIITIVIPLNLKRVSNIILTIRKMYLMLLYFHERFLNFKENIGNSETRSNDIIITNNNRYNALNSSSKIEFSFMHIANELQKRALAGVGIPMNELVCRSSKLNLASLSAEKTDIRNAQYGISFDIPNINSGIFTSLNREKTIAEGASPNVILSANESSSFPIGEETFNNLADIPSKKSNTAPNTINNIAFL